MALLMEEAFKKTGRFKSELKDREQARLKAQQDEKKRLEKIRKEEQEENQRQQAEDLKKYKPFDDRWQSPKKKFLVHLIFSYVPADVADYAWTDKDLKEKKCCICGQALVSKEFALKNAGKFAELGINHLHKIVKGEPINLKQEFINTVGDVMMGIVSPYSSAAFCHPCFGNFYDWIEYMILRGNGQVNRIIQQRRLELSLTEDELKEYRTIIKEKDSKIMRQNLNSFLEKVRNKTEMPVNAP
jgi:hypothetical protein